jgi:DNA-directed RNA polymerase subunit alpha
LIWILSVRALNCLKAADVETLGELVAFNKNDLLKFRNFGKKSLTELEDLVTTKGLQFGMNVVKIQIRQGVINFRFKIREFMS